MSLKFKSNIIYLDPHDNTFTRELALSEKCNEKAFVRYNEYGVFTDIFTITEGTPWAAEPITIHRSLLFNDAFGFLKYNAGDTGPEVIFITVPSLTPKEMERSVLPDSAILLLGKAYHNHTIDIKAWGRILQFAGIQDIDLKTCSPETCIAVDKDFQKRYVSIKTILEGVEKLFAQNRDIDEYFPADAISEIERIRQEEPQRFDISYHKIGSEYDAF